MRTALKRMGKIEAGRYIEAKEKANQPLEPEEITKWVAYQEELDKLDNRRREIHLLTEGQAEPYWLLRLRGGWGNPIRRDSQEANVDGD